jgi:hypothetical protein
MKTLPLIVDLIINLIYNASALIDSGYLYYILVSRRFARRSYLKRFSITLQTIKGINRKLLEIKEVARFKLDIHGYRESAYAYVISYIAKDIVLGKG